MAHLRCAGPDISVCQQREKRSSGNWWLIQRRGGEAERLKRRWTDRKNEGEVAMGRRRGEEKRKQNKKWRIGMRMRAVNEDFRECVGDRVGRKGSWRGNECLCWCEEVKNNSADTIPPPVKSNSVAYSSGYLSCTRLLSRCQITHVKSFYIWEETARRGNRCWLYSLSLCKTYVKQYVKVVYEILLLLIVLCPVVQVKRKRVTESAEL